MRLAGLDLVRYGRFTDARLDLPRRPVDLHVVHGPNEAGKSTARAAISDLLYGFPHQTRWDFLHDQTSLSLGGLVESEGRQLAFRRRKGRKDTLLSPEGAPLGEDALASFLAGVSRETFESLYSLDAESLRRGGEAVLEAKDDLGRLIFEAGTGLAGVTARLRELEAAAEEIWAPRARIRRLNERLEALEEASRRLRDGQGDVAEWEEANDALQKAEAARETARERRKLAQAHLDRLRRAQRVRPLLRQLAGLEAQLAESTDDACLPAGLGERLDAAEGGLREAEQAARLAAEALAREHERREALRLDEAILQQGGAVEALVRQAHVVAKSEEDLTRRHVELAGLDSRLARLLADLGRPDMPPERAAEALGSRPALAALREGLKRRAELARERTDLDQRLAEHRRERDRLAATLDGAGEADDDAMLVAALERAREAQRLSAGLAEARRRAGRQSVEAARRAARLDPPLPEGADPESLPLPPEAEVKRFAERWVRLDEQASRGTAALHDAREALAQREAEHARLASRSDAVSTEALAAARARRDALWLQVRDQRELPPALIPTFEAAIWEADALADRRFLGAEASARLVQATAAVESARVALAAAEERGRAAGAEREALRAEWQALWRASGIEPGLPTVMGDWLKGHRELCESRAEAEAEAQRVAGDERGIAEAMASLAAVLGIEARPLHLLVAEAEARLRRAAEGRAARKEREDQLAGLDQRLAEAKARHAHVAAEAAEAAQGWTRMLAAAGLGSDLPDIAVEAALELMEELRVAAERAAEHRERIAKMDRDRESFAAAVSERAAALGEAPVEDPFAVAERLRARLAAARRVADQAADHDRRIAETARAREEAETAARLARENLEGLLAGHGAPDPAALRLAIAAAEERRRLEERHAALGDQLVTVGDARDRATLEAEVAEIEEEEVPGLAAEADVALKEAESELAAAMERTAEAKAALARFTGGVEAARAAQDRADALAAVAGEAERWLELRAAAEVLRMAMDRYRAQHQSPLLARAGGHLRTITDGSFTALEAGWDSSDRPVLRALRPNGRPVAPDGLSEGTRDQLFLALRLAAVEQALDDGNALPFVADDLFATFDEGRTGAALRTLASFARQTQVLVFTHHEHVATLAAEAGAAIHRLEAADARPERVLEAAT